MSKIIQFPKKEQKITTAEQLIVQFVSCIQSVEPDPERLQQLMDAMVSYVYCHLCDD